MIIKIGCIGVIIVCIIVTFGIISLNIYHASHNLDQKQFLNSIEEVGRNASQEKVLEWIVKTEKEQQKEGREVIYLYTKPDVFRDGYIFYDSYFSNSGLPPETLDGYYHVRIKGARLTTFKSWDTVVLFFFDKDKKLVKHTVHEEHWGF